LVLRVGTDGARVVFGVAEKEGRWVAGCVGGGEGEEAVGGALE
jgi:hypothetical protein